MFPPIKEHIRAAVQMLAARLLRRHVSHGAESLSRTSSKLGGVLCRVFRGGNGLRQSKIQHLGASARGDEQIGGLNIAMDHAGDVPNGGPSKRFRIVGGVPVEDAPPPPQEPLPEDVSIPVSNSAHQLIFWSRGISTPPRIKTADGRVFPSASNNFAMNDLGQIFTADPMVISYADATKKPAPLPSQDYYNHLIDLTPLALQGMPPFRTEHGKPVYGFGVISDYGTVAINNVGELAFYVFYARKPGQNFDGSAVLWRSYPP